MYNNKPAEAEAAFKKFLAMEGADAALKADANRQLEAVKFGNMQMARKDLSRYSVSKAPLNAPGATYAPASMDGRLVFTSTRADAGYSPTNPTTNKGTGHCQFLWQFHVLYQVASGKWQKAGRHL